jgi:uncharacterized membrane protein YkoI
MRRRTRYAIGAAAAVAVLAVGTGVGIASSSDDDAPLRGIDLERATAAALAHVGAGTVIDSEVGDEGAAYSVEIRLDGGGVVEVNLDAGFHVIGSEADDGSSQESGADDTD